MIHPLKIFFLLIISSCYLIPCDLYSQLKQYQFEDIDSLQNIEQRNVFVFIHTDWCKYCQLMKNTTLKSRDVVDKLNKNYYFISHNGEEKRNITIDGKIFKYKPTGLNTGMHQLSKEIATLNNTVSYPTICILNPQKEIVFQHNNYLGVKDLLAVLAANDRH